MNTIEQTNEKGEERPSTNKKKKGRLETQTGIECGVWAMGMDIGYWIMDNGQWTTDKDNTYLR